MKKALMLAAAVALIAAPVFAEGEAPTLGSLHGATGSVEFSFGDDNIGAGDGFGFGSSADGSTTGSVKASVATEKVEAGATISLVPSVELNKHDDTYDTLDINVKAYQDVIDWYDSSEYGFAAYDWETNIGAAYYTDADGFDIDAALIDTAANFAAVKATIEGVITAQVEAQIDAMGAAASVALTYASASAGNYYVNGFGDICDGNDVPVILAASQADIDIMDDVNDATNEYDDFFNGVNGSDTYDVSYPVSDAYLRLLAVAGVVDVEFLLNGKNVGVGSKFTKSTDDDPLHLGIGLAMTEGVVEGLSASVLYVHKPATDVSEEKYTWAAEADSSDSVHSLQFNAGYAAEMFNVAADMAIADFADAELWYSIRGGLSMADIFGLAVNAEFTGMGESMGMGLAADAKATFFGITPSVDFRYHIEGTKLTDAYDINDGAYDKTTGDKKALDYFNSALPSAGYLGFGLSADLAELMGMNLITVNGGFAMVFGGANDWNVGLALDFTDLFAPVTVNAGLSSAYDAKISWNAGVGAEFFGITAALGVADDIADDSTALTFDASVGYTYDVVALSAAFGINKDSEKSLSMTAKVSF